MLNGFAPTFTTFGNEAYDSDVVRAAIDAIARNAAKLKPRHIRRKDGNLEPSNSRLERMLQIRPNPYMDTYSFLYKVITQLYLKNNSFIFVAWNENGTLRELYPVNSASTELLENNGEIYVRFNFMSGQQAVVPYNDVIHLRRFFYKNDMYGETSDAALNPTLELIHTTNEGIQNAIKTSANLRGLLKYTTMLKDEDIRKNKEIFVRDYMSVSNNGGIAALDSKAEYQELKNEPKMVDEKQMSLIENKVYKYFGVNEQIVMSKYSEDDWNSFYESILEPLALQMSLEFTQKLFTETERNHGNEIIFEANRLQYASNQTKISVIETLMDRGLMSMNEAREVFNLAPIEDGEKRIVSLNFVSADLADQYQVGKGGDENGQDPSEDEGS